MIDEKTIKKVGDLASLSLSTAELEHYQQHFKQVINYFRNLEVVDTQSVEPLMAPHQESGPLRSDEVIQSLSTDELLKNAPDAKDSLFKVPPVV